MRAPASSQRVLLCTGGHAGHCVNGNQDVASPPIADRHTHLIHGNEKEVEELKEDGVDFAADDRPAIILAMQTVPPLSVEVPGQPDAPDSHKHRHSQQPGVRALCNNPRGGQRFVRRVSKLHPPPPGGPPLTCGEHEVVVQGKVLQQGNTGLMGH